VLEALDSHSWKGKQHKEYSMRELVTAAKNMGCPYPSTKTERLIEVTLERARCLPKNLATGLSPDTYVVIHLEGFEAKSRVRLGTCDPSYNERLRLYIPGYYNHMIFLRYKVIYLSYKVIFLSYKVIFLNYNMMFLSYKVTSPGYNVFMSHSLVREDIASKNITL